MEVFLKNGLLALEKAREMFMPLSEESGKQADSLIERVGGVLELFLDPSRNNVPDMLVCELVSALLATHRKAR